MLVLASSADCFAGRRVESDNASSPHPDPLPTNGHAQRGRSVPGEGTVAIVEGVAPGNPYLGVMLPYTPLHYLLMAAIGRPIVCTSGNLSEDPMAISAEDAIARLGSIADVFLTHNRPIVRPVDDSIVRFGPLGVPGDAPCPWICPAADSS